MTVNRNLTVGVIVAFKPELRERALARGYSGACSSRSGSEPG